MVRGIEKRPVFHSECDREVYAETLTRVFSDARTSCLAWSFMPNHVHLLVRTGSRPLAHVMQRVGTAYARYFNRCHARVGYVFQGRYKALLVEEDEYLMALLRYIHLNPVRAGIVSFDALEVHPWTGHAALMGRRSCAFQAIGDVLDRFGLERNVARAELRSWMSAGDGRPHTSLEVTDPELGFDGCAGAERSRSSGDARVLGRPEFALEMQRLSGEQPALAPACDPHVITRLIESVSARLAADVRALREGRRTACESDTRAAVAYLAVNELGFSQVEVAPALGVTPSALSRSMARGAEIARIAGLRAMDAAPKGTRETE
jgi:REP element-mobilizing transposase RayT